MPAFRRKVNKVSKQLHSTKKNSKSKCWIGGDGLARGEFDVKDIDRLAKAQKKYDSAMNSRSKGVVGRVRLSLASKEAKKRLRKISNIKSLGKDGLVIKSRKVMIGSKYDSSVRHLLGNIQPGKKITTISKRGNVRKGKLISASNGFITIEMDGKKTPLRADRIEKVRLIK